MTRVDETWFRVLFWTQKGGFAERMSAQLLHEAGFEEIILIHPGGGPDNGADATCKKDDQDWVMACYFPFGPKTPREVERKLEDDIAATQRERKPDGIVFVTNQKVTDSERKRLGDTAADLAIKLDLFELERVAHILDRSHMASTREQYLDLPAASTPSSVPRELPEVLVKAEIIGSACYFTNGGELMEVVADSHAQRFREGEETLRERQEREARRQPWEVDNPAFLVPLLGQRPGSPPARTTPLADEEIEQSLAGFNEELRQRWGRCTEYLAANAWPVVRFRIVNETARFLKNVQVILTVHNAKGLRSVDPSTFVWEKLEDPSWRPSTSWGLDYRDFVPSSNSPFDMQTVGDDLVVTIDLPELRPYPVWESGDTDVVLMAKAELPEAVTVTWTVTAEDYDGHFEGPPMSVPAEASDALEATKYALEASEG